MRRVGRDPVCIMSAPNETPIRVLVVEDHEDDYHFLCHVFRHTQNLAYRLEWAPTYGDGLRALHGAAHDIALFDYTLGADTGVDLLREAQSMGCTMPIILLTGHDDAKIDEAALAAGAADFLCKTTLDHVHLERAIRYALRQARMRADLRSSRQQLEVFMQSLPVIAGRIDANGFVTEARGRGLEYAGMKPDELIGQNLVHNYPQAAEAVRQAVGGESAPFTLSGRNAEEVEWHAEFFAMFDAARGEGAIFVGRDVSVRRWLEHRLLTVSDAEQQRIGADLHDGLGQQLTGLSCLAAALRDRLKQKLPQEAAQAEMIAHLANDAVAQSRALARGLCPVQLENAGLVVALEELAVQAHTLHGVPCTFAATGPAPGCDHVAAMHLYRITQEAIHNAVRHGKARHVHVTLDTQHNQHRLMIEDDGDGFDTVAYARKPGGGLRLMGYRAAMVGGVFTVDSQPGRGTRVGCEFSTFPSQNENQRTGKESDPEDCEIAC